MNNAANVCNGHGAWFYRSPNFTLQVEALLKLRLHNIYKDFALSG